MGLFGGQSFNPAQHIPDLTGKIIIVTGGNIGLGRETVQQLCKHNPAHIYLAARTEKKAQDAIAEIRANVTNAAPISFLPLDLTSFDSIKAAAETFNGENNRLDILVNNAGIMATPAGTTTEGYEIQFGTNHMGHALFTKLLLPTMQRTTKETPGADVRVVNLSSAALSWAPPGGLIPSTYKTNMEEYATLKRYGQSKLANVHFTRAMAERNPDITCVAVHPGVISTNLTNGVQSSYPRMAPFIRGFVSTFFGSVETGAKNQLWACVSKDVKSGALYFPVGKETAGSPYAQDKKMTEQLWEWTEGEFKAHGY